MATDAPPVVLLHGWGLHGGIMAPVAQAMARDGRQVRCLDLPGHGGRPFDPPFDGLGQLAAQVAPDLPPRCTLVGWSLGGMVAAWLAAQPGSAIGRLVLVATTPRFVAGGNWAHGIDTGTIEDFAAGLERDYQDTVRRFLSLQSRGADHAGTVLRQLRSEVFRRGEPDRRALRAGLEILRAADLREEAGHIRVPTLVIGGEYDRLPLPGAVEWLARRIPGARLAMLRGAGHAPFLSHPQEFLAACDDFLAEPATACAGADA